MTERTIKVKVDLDARRAAFFVQTASRFTSDLHVVIRDKKINAKSIMGTISLGIAEGQTATIVANGNDESQAIEEICAVLEQGE